MQTALLLLFRPFDASVSEDRLNGADNTDHGMLSL